MLPSRVILLLEEPDGHRKNAKLFEKNAALANAVRCLVIWYDEMVRDPDTAKRQLNAFCEAS
jgi:hypothetical protein